MRDEEMSIGELARRAGVKASALRYYEEVGLLRPRRRVSGQRRFGPEAEERLAVIRFAQDAGFTLREIGVLVATLPQQPLSAAWKRLARAKLDDVRDQIARLERMGGLLEESLACDCVDLESCAVWTRAPARLSSS